MNTSNLDPHTITLHRCSNGNIVLQFGVTMIHLRPDVFSRFSDMLTRYSEQISQDKTSVEIDMPYLQPGEA